MATSFHCRIFQEHLVGVILPKLQTPIFDCPQTVRLLTAKETDSIQSGWRTKNGKKLSSSQAQLGQVTTYMAVA